MKLSKEGKSYYLLRILKHFCRETTLHGFRHIVQKYDRNSTVPRYVILFRSILWIGLTLCSVVLCVYMILLVWHRYDTAPTQTLIETVHYPISKVAFPAVTVCSINKVYEPRTGTIKHILEKGGVTSDDIMKYITSISHLVTMEPVDSSVIRAESVLEQFGFTPEKVMLEVSIPCNQLITNCSWNGKPRECETLFRRIKSSNGFCCSFNYHALKEEYEMTNPHTTSSTSGVQRLSGAGEYVGLYFSTSIDPTHYLSTTEDYIGVEVLIHNSKDFPDTLASTSLVQMNQDLRVILNPDLIVSNDGIRSMDVEQRNCWFDDETKLVIAKEYSFESCMVECRARYMVEICGCMPFFFPAHKPNGTTSVVRQCTMADLSCLATNRATFFNFIEKVEVKPPNFVGMECDCLPTCSTYLFNPTSSIATKIPRIINGEITYNSTPSSVRVYFEDLASLKYLREPAMTWDGLFSSFGGVYSFCLGGSFISIIEFGYYFIIDTIARHFEKKPVLPLYSNELWATKSSKKVLSMPYQNLIRLSAATKTKII